MKPFLPNPKPSKIVLSKYSYQKFLVHKEKRLIERLANEIINGKKVKR
jgi:hypothetical protein